MNELIHSDTFLTDIMGRDQEKLLNDLFKIEASFQKKILKSSVGKSVYRGLVDYFNADDKNVLSLHVRLKTQLNLRRKIGSNCLKSKALSKIIVLACWIVI